MSEENLRQSQLEILLLVQREMKDRPGGIVPLKQIIHDDNTERKPVQIQLSVQRLYESGWLERPVYGGYRLTEKAKDRIKEVLGVG